MKHLEKVRHWLESGKQIGEVFSFEKNSEKYWSSVGVQKWEGYYKVYVDEILESKMAAEDYSIEKIARFDSIELVEDFISANTKTKLELLTPCKGQKIFNPAFEQI
jgi:hypothetical protein